MANMEPSGFCSKSEYSQHRNERVRSGSELQADQLYTVMMSLGSQAYEAARKTVRVESTCQREGRCIVQLSFVDDKFDRESTTESEFTDGFLGRFGHVKSPDLQGESDPIPILECYIKDYFDEIYDFLDKTEESIGCW